MNRNFNWIYTRFLLNIDNLKPSKAMYEYLKANQISIDATDLLRWQWIETVSAMDKFFHDLILAGIEYRIQKNRLTPKLSKTSIPFESARRAISQKQLSVYQMHTFFSEMLCHYSFQNSRNIADGLSLIWSEEHKWQQLNSQSAFEGDLKKTIDLVASRRNQIVHQADFPDAGLARGTLSNSELSVCEDSVSMTVKTAFKLVVAELETM